MAVLVDANDPGTADITTRELQVAAQSLGLRTHFLNASTERDLDAAFKKVAQIEAGGLVIGAGVFLASRSKQLAALAVRHAVPTVFESREFVASGGLASYSGNLAVV